MKSYELLYCTPYGGQRTDSQTHVSVSFTPASVGEETQWAPDSFWTQRYKVGQKEDLSC